MDHAFEHPIDSFTLPQVRQVPAGRALVWLQRGWADLRRLGLTSLGHGIFVSGFGVVLLALSWTAPYLVPAFAGGFLLVAPFAAIGVYALSQQIENGEPVSPPAAMFAWRRNANSIALFGLLLALALIFWERVAAILFAMFYAGTAPDVNHLTREMLSSADHWPLLVAFFGTGFLFAATVFSLSVVTVPMLLDKPVDVVTAALTSLRCCTLNSGAMLVWAALIAGLCLLGFATAMIGMVVVFPWLGHATWHAYQDLVGQVDES